MWILSPGNMYSWSLYHCFKYPWPLAQVLLPAKPERQIWLVGRPGTTGSSDNYLYSVLNRSERVIKRKTSGANSAGLLGQSLEGPSFEKVGNSRLLSDANPSSINAQLIGIDNTALTFTAPAVCMTFWQCLIEQARYIQIRNYLTVCMDPCTTHLSPT